MRRSESSRDEELRGEYDFAKLPGGIRGKYLRRYRAGTNLALLDPDVAAAFPTDQAVNEALRVVLKAASAVRRNRRASTKPLHRPTGAGKVSDQPVGKKRAIRR